MGFPKWCLPAALVSAGMGEKSQSLRAMRLPELGLLLKLDSSCQLWLPASVSLGRDGELLAWKGSRVFPLDAYYWRGSWLTLLCQLCQASLVFPERVPLDLREIWTYLGFLLLSSWGLDNTRYEWSSVEGGIEDVLPLYCSSSPGVTNEFAFLPPVRILLWLSLALFPGFLIVLRGSEQAETDLCQKFH